MTDTFRLGDIQHNPFRSLEKCPLITSKIEALRESLRETGYWDNVVARTANGSVELAYGHHRLEAMIQEYGPDEKVELIIKPLTDEYMLKILARENMQEYNSNAAVEHDTIRNVIEAYGAGKIELPAPPPDTNKAFIRYAPSFLPGGPSPRPGQRPYTAQTVGQFVGWIKSDGRAMDRVSDALSALAFIEDGTLKEHHFVGLTTYQSQAVINETRKSKNRHETRAKQERKKAEVAKKQAEEARAKKVKAEAEGDGVARANALERERDAKSRAKIAEQEEAKATALAKTKPPLVGAAVADSIKSGEIGHRQASDVASDIEIPDKTEKTVTSEQIARRVGSKIANVLYPRKAGLSIEIEEVIRLRKHIGKEITEDLAKTLERLSYRALDYAARLRGNDKPLR